MWRLVFRVIRRTAQKILCYCNLYTPPLFSIIIPSMNSFKNFVVINPRKTHLPALFLSAVLGLGLRAQPFSTLLSLAILLSYTQATLPSRNYFQDFSLGFLALALGTAL